ncbi:MAG: DUF433 domain-containing protein [Chloroflexota bacterium]
MTERANRNGAASHDDPYVAEHPGVCGGYPVLRDTRISVRILVELSRDGASIDDFVNSWPYIARERFVGAMEYYRRHPERIDEDIERHRLAYAEVSGGTWPDR